MIRDPYGPVPMGDVIRGLTDKFNHYRVKEYNLHAFRDPHSVFCALMHAYAERESEARFRYRVSDNASTDGYTHIQNYVKIPVLASILVNTVGYVSS